MNILKAITMAVTLATAAASQAADIIGRANLKLQSDRMTPEVLWAM